MRFVQYNQNLNRIGSRWNVTEFWVFWGWISASDFVHTVLHIIFKKSIFNFSILQMVYLTLHWRKCWSWPLEIKEYSTDFPLSAIELHSWDWAEVPWTFCVQLTKIVSIIQAPLLVCLSQWHLISLRLFSLVIAIFTCIWRQFNCN